MSARHRVSADLPHGPRPEYEAHENEAYSINRKMRSQAKWDARNAPKQPGLF
jgi:hypothetical protein